MERSVSLLTLVGAIFISTSTALGTDRLVPSVYPTIQAGINAAVNGDRVIIAQGTYTGDGNRDIDFLGKAITVRSVDPEDPYVVAATIIDCNSTELEPHCGFNIHSGEDSNSIVSGLTITGGYGANLSFPYYHCGGGIFIKKSNPTIEYCRIIGNSGQGGGGICCEKAKPTIRNCIIADNVADDHYMSAGSGMYINGCGFGHWYEKAEPNIVNCTIVGNSAFLAGGGIFARMGCKIKVNNCILWGNTAPEGHEIAMAPMYDAPQPYISISYCDIQGGRDEVSGYAFVIHWLDGNIDVDPCFADAGSGDYHLQSQAGRWDPNSQSWVTDANTSVAIDAGDMADPVGLEPFPNGGIINMGVYGGTAEASKSYFGSPVCKTIVAGDINGDCKVDFLDFALMAFHWLESND